MRNYQGRGINVISRVKGEIETLSNTNHNILR